MPRPATRRQNATAPHRRRERTIPSWLAAFLIVAAGSIAYVSSFAGVFVLDDDISIVSNPHVRALWPLSDALSAPIEATVAGRPIVSLSLAVSYALSGLDDRWGFHSVNLVIHLAAALVLFGIARRTMLAWDHRRNQVAPASDRTPTGVALAIALIWCVHPLQTGSVTYIVQRSESLMGLFYLLTLYCAIRAHAEGGRGVWIVASIVFCALGMASKETMVTVPLVAKYSLAPPAPLSPTPRTQTPQLAGLVSTGNVPACTVVPEKAPTLS